MPDLEVKARPRFAAEVNGAPVSPFASPKTGSGPKGFPIPAGPPAPLPVCTMPHIHADGTTTTIVDFDEEVTWNGALPTWKKGAGGSAKSVIQVIPITAQQFELHWNGIINPDDTIHWGTPDNSFRTLAGGYAVPFFVFAEA